MKTEIIIFFLVFYSLFIFHKASVKTTNTTSTLNEKTKESYTDKHEFKSKAEIDKEIKVEVDKELKQEMKNIDLQVQKATKDLKKPKKKKNKKRKRGGIRSGGFMEIIQFGSRPLGDPFNPFDTFNSGGPGGFGIPGNPRNPGNPGSLSGNITLINHTFSSDGPDPDDIRMLKELDEIFNINTAFNDPFGPTRIKQTKPRNLQIKNKILPAGQAINGISYFYINNIN